MMKKAKSFNIGDKVFAKVKGYPAWPAKIVGANGKKYEVTFYGTMETGSIKVEDLFYYLKHKDQFYRNLKRKDYQEAVEQIETEIKETGTDGNNGDESDASVINDGVDKRGKKRKNDSIVEELPAKKRNTSASEEVEEPQVSEQEEKTVENTSQEIDVKSSSQSITRSGRIVKVKKFSDDEDEDSAKKGPKVKKSTLVQEHQNIEDESNENIDDKEDNIETLLSENDNQESEKEKEETQVEKSITNIEPEETTSSTKTTENKESKLTEKEDEIIDVNIVSTDYLDIVIAYAAHMKSKTSLHKKRPVEQREVQENEVVVAKLPSDKLIGIKYNRTRSLCDNEYEEAISEGQEAKRVLSLKCKLEDGSTKMENEKDQLVMNIQVTEEELQQKNDLRILERKKVKLEYLKIEASLVDYDSKIKGCLGLDKADPKKAFEYMDLMMELDIRPLMLKKHPLIADVMKRLRRYIGNVKEWKLSGDPLETFEADAEKIRQKAEDVFIKFISLFNATDNSSFWDVFSSEVAKFEEDTKDMSESELFALCAEPNSRQAFFDSYDDKKEAEKANNDTEKNEEKEKENSSDIANTEQATETPQNNIDTP